jgi:60S ribosome subunit biogenesis protein NIP7
MTFRMPTLQEQTLVNRALDRWGVFDALKGHALLVHGGSGKVCLVSPELASVAMKVQPAMAGLAIGELGKKKQFTPTLAGASLFARAGGRGKYYVRVSQNAENLVLYGRDVMGESIVEVSPELGENELVIILNLGGEAIGIGRTRFSGKSILQKGRVTITTLADAGSYLRDEVGGGGGGEEGNAKMMMARQPKKKNA